MFLVEFKEIELNAAVFHSAEPPSIALRNDIQGLDFDRACKERQTLTEILEFLNIQPGCIECPDIVWTAE